MAMYQGKHLAPGRRNRKVFAAVLAVFLLAASATAVMAYYLRQEEMKNSLAMSYVSCQANIGKSGNEITDIAVDNTSNVKAYIRVRLVSYWKTPSGDVYARESATPKLTDEMLAEGWIADLDSDTYYYSIPIQELGGALDSTPDLLKDGKSITLIVDAEGYIQAVEILAEAIQAEPAEAVTTAWGVTLDADGSIINP